MIPDLQSQLAQLEAEVARQQAALTALEAEVADMQRELSEFQLRRHGRLAPEKTAPASEHLDRLAPEFLELIERTRRFHARIERLDRAWRARFEVRPAAVHRLHERLGEAVAGV